MMTVNSSRSLLAALLMTMTLAACVGGNVRPADVAQYDLGVAVPAASPAIALRGVDVQAPSWLGTTAIQYRLAYQNASRRLAFVESRWAAPPAELLEISLRRQLVAGETGKCRLKIELDEFAQVFDAANQSRAVLEARVSLIAGKGDQILARHILGLSKPTTSADARGGVGAFAPLTTEAGKSLTEWLATLTTSQAALVAPCR